MLSNSTKNIFFPRKPLFLLSPQETTTYYQHKKSPKTVPTYSSSVSLFIDTHTTFSFGRLRKAIRLRRDWSTGLQLSGRCDLLASRKCGWRVVWSKFTNGHWSGLLWYILWRGFWEVCTIVLRILHHLVHSVLVWLWGDSVHHEIWAKDKLSVPCYFSMIIPILDISMIMRFLHEWFSRCWCWLGRKNLVNSCMQSWCDTKSHPVDYTLYLVLTGVHGMGRIY